MHGLELFVRVLTTAQYLPCLPGIGDEYHDAGESDDGDADTGGFAFASSAAGVERQAHENAVRNNEESGDSRWHDTYR